MMVNSPEQQKSSSSSSDTSSEKSTPPSSPDVPEVITAPRPVAHYSSTPPRRGGRHAYNNSATNRLGAIDEESQVIAPDIPCRNCNRPKRPKTYLPADAKKFFSFSSYSRPDKDVPPPDFYEKVIGPHGEKFTDLRKNKPFKPEGRGGGWRRMVCLGLVILLVLAIVLGVGLGVGLTRHKGARYLSHILSYATEIMPPLRDYALSLSTCAMSGTSFRSTINLHCSSFIGSD